MMPEAVFLMQETSLPRPPLWAVIVTLKIVWLFCCVGGEALALPGDVVILE